MGGCQKKTEFWRTANADTISMEPPPFHYNDTWKADLPSFLVILRSAVVVRQEKGRVYGGGSGCNGGWIPPPDNMMLAVVGGPSLCRFAPAQAPAIALERRS